MKYVTLTMFLVLEFFIIAAFSVTPFEHSVPILVTNSSIIRSMGFSKRGRKKEP